MMDKNTTTLAKYLFTKGIEPSLKIQKMLFFFRVEELTNNEENGFFKNNHNFEAWIYGPVNYESFKFMQRFFNDNEEKEILQLNEQEVREIDELYIQYFNKYCDFEGLELVNKSHKNKAWIEARAGIEFDKPSRNLLEENESFITFI